VLEKSNSVFIRGANLASMQDGSHDYGILEADVLVKGERILKLVPRGDTLELPANTRILEVDGAWLLPGLIDAHTHLVFAGSRAQEFERRLLGESYESIARSGGGILSTVQATRNASESQLLSLANHRIQAWIREGVTSIEIKSGYGLDLDTELKMLRVARRLEQENPIRVHTSFLGAHALPVEYQNSADAYIKQIIDHWLPEAVAQGLVDAVDVFCERIGFSLEQTRRVYESAKQLGVPVRGHVEQLSYLGGARLAAEFNALSVDHVEYLTPEDCALLASSGTVATLLPLAFYHLGETQLPPVAALRSHQVPMVVGSDFNPGSAPLASLLLALNMSTRLFQLTPEEALRGITQHAAKAIGHSELGQIKEGAIADLGIWNLEHPSELAYSFGVHSPLYRCVKGHWYQSGSQKELNPL
jgi:imidazolonepropionase